jgi:MSHA biogenesis protein MshK
MAAGLDKMLWLGRLCVMLAWWGMPAWAAAETLPDPTRPPPGIRGGEGGETHAETSAEPERKGLQVIIIAPNRRAAIIDGQTVELGGRYHGAKLIEVNEGALVLRDAHGKRTVITMFPKVGVRQKAAEPAPQAGSKEPEPIEKQTIEQAASSVAPREEK